VGRAGGTEYYGYVARLLCPTPPCSVREEIHRRVTAARVFRTKPSRFAQAQYIEYGSACRFQPAGAASPVFFKDFLKPSLEILGQGHELVALALQEGDHAIEGLRFRGAARVHQDDRARRQVV
jgi:hypothetical protein